MTAANARARSQYIPLLERRTGLDVLASLSGFIFPTMSAFSTAAIQTSHLARVQTHHTGNYNVSKYNGFKMRLVSEPIRVLWSSLHPDKSPTFMPMVHTLFSSLSDPLPIRMKARHSTVGMVL
jgi:hypothetical protein